MNLVPLTNEATTPQDNVEIHNSFPLPGLDILRVGGLCGVGVLGGGGVLGVGEGKHRKCEFVPTLLSFIVDLKSPICTQSCSRSQSLRSLLLTARQLKLHLQNQFFSRILATLSVHAKRKALIVLIKN